MAANVSLTEESQEAIVDCVAFCYEEGKGGENFRKKNKVRRKAEKKETPAEAKELCLVNQWNQYLDLHCNERTESLIRHEKSLLISRNCARSQGPIYKGALGSRLS